MSEPRLGMTVDGPVKEGGEYFLIKPPSWPPFDTDRTEVISQESWDWAAGIAQFREGWIVMWVQVQSHDE